VEVELLAFLTSSLDRGERSASSHVVSKTVVVVVVVSIIEVRKFKVCKNE
jgi:hypothetical protein